MLEHVCALCRACTLFTESVPKNGSRKRKSVPSASSRLMSKRLMNPQRQPLLMQLQFPQLKMSLNQGRTVSCACGESALSARRLLSCTCGHHHTGDHEAIHLEWILSEASFHASRTRMPLTSGSLGVSSLAFMSARGLEDGCVSYQTPHRLTNVQTWL